MIRNPRGRTATTDIRPVPPGAPHSFDDSSREQGIMNRYLRPLGTNREQAIMNQYLRRPSGDVYAGGNSQREQAIMNQYARPRGDVYTGGNPATDTMAALMGGMNRPQLEGIMQMAGGWGSLDYMPDYMFDYEDPDFTPSYISPSVIEMDMMPGMGITDWEGKWETTADPYDWD